MNNPPRRSRGFSLIELVIAMAITAILAVVALPSYRQYMVRSHRSAAQAQMMDIANREQQYFLATRTYAAAATLTASGYALPSEVAAFYSFTITLQAGPPPGYIITFTPSGTQASDGALTLNSAGVKSPADKW